MTSRTAIILFNLGGPDTQAAVQPFLQNLFSDPAIIRLPTFLRLPLAKFIAARRAPKAKGIYQQMGGGSPILPNTEAQARALEAELGAGFKCFIAMRYWHPLAPQTAAEVKAWGADKVVYLPLYPQFSSTTTASSVKDFATLVPPTHNVCCYPFDDGFITAQAELIRPQLEQAAKYGKPRLLLSAHGLPEKVIKDGDPYQWQCEQTARAIVAKLNMPELDWLNCYQSRVGPLKWIGPATEQEIERAGHDKVPVVLAPIAFVSEHSETLVELDIEYRELAHEVGVPFYGRVPVVATHPAFIAALATRVRAALAGEAKPRLCPPDYKDCPCRVNA
jgi:ferrochelatase